MRRANFIPDRTSREQFATFAVVSRTRIGLDGINYLQIVIVFGVKVSCSSNTNKYLPASDVAHPFFESDLLNSD
jgi:hypothetical protein